MILGSLPTVRAPHRAWQFCASCALSLALVALTGCASIPQGAAAVDSIDVKGNVVVSSSDIEDKLATTSSSKFLLLFRGFVVDYTLFDPFVLAKDLARVEALYRANGFYDAHARAGRVEYVAKDHVQVTIVVEEGPPIIVRDVVLDGVEDLPPPIAAAVKSAAVSKVHRGARFVEDDYTATEKAITRALTDRGYAYAKTTRTAEIDLPGHFALPKYVVVHGPPAKFGEVKIDGLGNLPEATVRRAIDITPGTPYSTSAIESARQALLDLGVFGDVTITPALPDPPPENVTVPLQVHVERSKLQEVTLGGGIEFDPIKTDLHLLAGWADHNFLGGLRNFHIQFRPGVVLYPLRMQTPFDAPTNLLPEEKLRAELRQPGFIEARTAGILRSELNTYPILLTPQQSGPGVPVLGYIENKEAIGVDRSFWKLYASPTYNFQHDQPFAYIPPRDPSLGPINLSYIDLVLRLDFRDDKIHPHKGLLLSADTQFAGLGGDARDIREQPDVRFYVPLARRLTWALRGTTGFLVPFNSYATIDNPALQSEPAYHAEYVKESQLLYLRGFFSGGPTSNRGYPLYGVGPHGAVPFFNPQIAANNVANSCSPTTFDPSHCAVPEGGFTLWEASTELRVGVSGPFEVAGFCDASDVEQARFSYKFNDATRYHLSCGAGARYDTPVGPIRLDIGYRIPGLNPDFSKESVQATEGDPGTIAGLPIAISLGIGESF
jgi:outer membrane protein insertion porin family/translocation and assembly module TamA